MANFAEPLDEEFERLRHITVVARRRQEVLQLA
jgi:hypothetical protein